MIDYKNLKRICPVPIVLMKSNLDNRESKDGYSRMEMIVSWESISGLHDIGLEIQR